MFGNILQPDECWMLDGRLTTVALRMNRQSKNAQRVAEALHGHKLLSRVIYPTLFTDPEQKRIFEKQCDFPGGMFSIEFHGGKEAAFEFLRHVRIARNAVSLGSVESLTCHPKSTTHSGMSREGTGGERGDGRAGADLGGDRGLARSAGRLRAGPGRGWGTVGGKPFLAEPLRTLRRKIAKKNLATGRRSFRFGPLQLIVSSIHLRNFP